MTTHWSPYDPLALIPRTTAKGQAGFVDDVRWAASVCRRQPLLPVVSLLIGLSPLLAGNGGSSRTENGVITSSPSSPGWQSLGVLVGLGVFALLGFPGTQRLWFLRAATGRRLAAREILPLTFRYFGRFFVVGMVFFAVALVFALPAVVDYARGIEIHPDGTRPCRSRRGPCWRSPLSAPSSSTSCSPSSRRRSC